MKKLLSISLMLFSYFSQAQKIDTLKETQIVGITSGKNLPISQARINCEDFDYLNKQGDPFFVLSTATPSIYSQSDNGQENGYCYMRMRGLDQTRINYNLNGIPLNEMEDQGLYFSNMPSFYNYIGSINVERGVGSSKYGNTSVAGSVDMETRSISEKTFEINSLLKDSYNDQFSNLYYSSGINKEGLSLQLGGSLIRNNGFKEHSDNNGGSLYYSLSKIENDKIFKIYGFSGVSHNQLAFYGVTIDSINNNYKTNLNLSTDKDTFNQNLIAVNLTNFANPNRKFNSTAYFDNVNGTYNTGGILFGVCSYQFGIMSNMVIEHKQNIINIGINANIYSRKHFGYDNKGYYDVLQNSTLYTNVGHKEDVSAYIKGEHKNNFKSVFYDIQVRDVWFNTNNYKIYNWIFVNPKIGLRTKMRDNDIYFNFGITQKEPTRTDMIQNNVQNKYLGANTDNTIWLNDSLKLKPETVYDFEMGDNISFGCVDINANMYLMVINNEFVSTGVIDKYSGFMTKTAINATLRNGVEANIKTHFNKLNAFCNINIQHSSMGKGADITGIPFAPNYISSLGITYKRNSYTIGLIEQAVSSMVMNLSNDTTQAYNSSPYQITNMFLDIKTNSNITLSLKANNILNNKYYVPAGIAVIPTYYVGQLANYSITLKCKI